MHNIILSYIISNHTINHIKSSNIIKWLTVIQRRKKKKKSRKKKYQKTERVKEWNKKRVRVRVREKMKTLEERTKGKQKFIRNIYIEEIQKWRNKEKW